MGIAHTPEYISHTDSSERTDWDSQDLRREEMIRREHGSTRDSGPDRRRGTGRTNLGKTPKQDRRAEASDQECRANAPRSIGPEPRQVIRPPGLEVRTDIHPRKPNHPNPYQSYAIRLSHPEKPGIKPQGDR